MMVSARFTKTRSGLIRLGIPGGDDHSLSTSTKKFSDGGQFRIEVPTINSLRAAETVLNRSAQLGVFLNRITETIGIFRHSDAEIRNWAELCTRQGCELIMSPGPRAVYDTSASARSPEGARMAYRLRGQDQLVYALEDIKRAFDLGVSTFVIYDEGLLWVAAEMRRNGDLPAEVRFKVSAHCGHGNGASFRLMESLGADSINPVRDLDLAMLAALRAAVQVPIDCHTDNPTSSGGFLRFYEAAEFVRILAPVYLKTGNSVLTGHGHATSNEEATKMAEQAALVLETVQRHYPEAVQSGMRPRISQLAKPDRSVA